MRAEGELFLDDGVSQDTLPNGNYLKVSFYAGKGHIQSKIDHFRKGDFGNELIHKVEIVGLDYLVKNITINGQNGSKFKYENGRLTIWTDHSVKISQEFIIEYFH